MSARLSALRELLWLPSASILQAEVHRCWVGLILRRLQVHHRKGSFSQGKGVTWVPFGCYSTSPVDA